MSPKVYPGKLTAYVVGTCIAAAMGGLIFGYDIGISGGVTSMQQFQNRFFPAVEPTSKNEYCRYNNSRVTMFTSSLYLAALVASLASGEVTRKFGRKLSMRYSGVLYLAGSLLNALARNMAMLIIGRVFLGFGIGFANQSVPLYLSEMAPTKYRGGVNILFQMSVTVGILGANVLNFVFAKIHGSLSWRLSLGGAMVPAACIVVGSFFLPDTPTALIERGELEEARANLRRVRGVSNIDEEFEDLVAANQAAVAVTHPWKTLLQRKYRPQLTMAVLIPLFQQLTGINAIMFYAPVLFNSLGFNGNSGLASALCTGGVNFLATVISIVTVDRWGRRVFFVEGGIQMAISQVVVAACIAAKFEGAEGNPGDLPKWFAAVVVLFICVYVAAFAWSWGPLGWLVPSEIFPLEIRSAAQSITVSVNMLMTFVVAQLFLQILCYLKFGLFLLFAFCTCVMTAYIYYFLPETKGVPIDNMPVIWQNHWYWSTYVSEDN